MIFSDINLSSFNANNIGMRLASLLLILAITSVTFVKLKNILLLLQV